MPEPAVRIENLWKAYDGVQSRQGLSLAAFEGEIVGLIGPNGAGKTTAIKIIVGLLRWDRGDVFVLGHNVLEDSISYKEHIGYMPEAPALPEYLTTSEFLGYVGRIRNVPKEQLAGRVAELLKDFELTGKAKETIATLSKGMREKLSFAAATIHKPQLLILDEPLLGIDPAGQRMLKDRLVGMAKQGCSILASTHQLDTAAGLCTKVRITHRGKN